MVILELAMVSLGLTKTTNLKIIGAGQAKKEILAAKLVTPFFLRLINSHKLSVLKHGFYLTSDLFT